jgi:hypothetical protein
VAASSLGVADVVCDWMCRSCGVAARVRAVEVVAAAMEVGDGRFCRACGGWVDTG